MAPLFAFLCALALTTPAAQSAALEDTISPTLVPALPAAPVAPKPAEAAFAADDSVKSVAGVKDPLTVTPMMVHDAANIVEEVEHWKAQGYPLFLPFMTDSGKTELASVNTTSTDFAPLTTVDNYVTFHLYTKHNESDVAGKEFSLDRTFNKMKIADYAKVLMEIGFDPHLSTKIIIHGFMNSIQSPAVQLIKNAYLKTGKYNVIGVDWSRLVKAPDYFRARWNVGNTGIRVGKLLDFLVEAFPDHKITTHLIGHSLGAHVAGIAGKTMTLGRPVRITGLDPARPLFGKTAEAGRLVSNDADLVDVIHSNAGGLGWTEPIGTVDFYPNGGRYQPGCTWDVFGICAHGRSFLLFEETILGEAKLKGTFCKTQEEVLREQCHSTIHAVMGEPLDFMEKGLYHLKTNEKAPFSKSLEE